MFNFWFFLQPFFHWISVFFSVVLHKFFCVTEKNKVPRFWLQSTQMLWPIRIEDYIQPNIIFCYSWESPEKNFKYIYQGHWVDNWTHGRSEKTMGYKITYKNSVNYKPFFRLIFFKGKFLRNFLQKFIIFLCIVKTIVEQYQERLSNLIKEKVREESEFKENTDQNSN